MAADTRSATGPAVVELTLDYFIPNLAQTKHKTTKNPPSL